MSQYNPWTDISSTSVPRVDVQSLIQRVYLWMALGLAVTAFTAFLTLNTGLVQLALNPVVLLIASVGELVLVIGLSAGLRRMSPGLAATMFFVYSAMNGFTLSLIFIFFEVGTITSAFVATAALFGAMTLVGFTTKTDLTRMGSYLLMGVIGLVIAMLVNMFLGSGTLDLIISGAGVLIFTGLAAYDTQKIKRMANDPIVHADGSAAMKLSIMGALVLYLDFINLFLFLLRLLGAGSRD